ncbi:hypothetical protein [Hafnia paralvei]|uniref:tail fiber/spike domain-containing protein n=1 Tax=Hafnia paralvei TaxID=546367 RepID=UPI0018F10343|nr:hypothetical protein [Hafnia paralvei]MBW2957490.1 hypothetical protein [Hafnia paralvei]
MATQPTNLPVPSESPRDLKFNAGKIDEFVTSRELKYIDRFGGEHYTIEGISQLSKEAMASFGYITMDSFEDGNTLTLPNQVLRLEATGEYYRWDGTFPKVVPASSTPASTGGIGAGAWLSVGDATVRNWVKSNIGLSDTMDELISNLNTVGAAIIHGTHEVPLGGIEIPSCSQLIATGQCITASSADLTQIVGTGYFSKSDNSTVKVINPNNSEDYVEADIIAYISDKSIGMIGENEIFGSSTVIQNIALRGTAPLESGIGIFILNGGYHMIKNVQVHRAKYGLYIKDAWLSTFERFHTWGCVRQTGGTSSNYNACWARGHTDITGAFRFENLNYSVMDSCCSDRPRRGAFYFKNCIAVTLNSCATEGPGYFNNLMDTEGGAITFDVNNRMNITDFQVSPLSTYTGPLITVADNNNIRIERLFTNNGVAYTGADIYVHGNNSVINIEDAQVRGASTMPVIHIKPGSNSKVIVSLSGGNKVIFTAGITKDAPNSEKMFDKGTFTPTLSINSNNIGISYLYQVGTYSKVGNCVTVNFGLGLTSKGTSTGAVSIDNLPFNAYQYASGSLSNLQGASGAPFTIGTNASTKSRSLIVRRMASTSITPASESNISDSFEISGSITYQTDSLFNDM